MKLFDVVSIEEQTVETVETVEMTIEDVIGMEDRDHDVTIAANDLNAGIAMMDAALEVAANIEDQIAVEEAILDAGTATAGIAQLAMTNLQANARMLGLESADFAISTESMEQNPATALKVSVEAAKDTFKKIADQIKQFFVKMYAKLKKLAANILLSAGDFKKKFDALDGEVAKLGKDLKEGVKPELEEAEAKKLVNKFYGVFAANGGKLVPAKLDNASVQNGHAEYASQIISTLDTEKVAEAVKKAAVGSTIGDLAKEYDGIPEAGENIGAVISRADGVTVKGMLFTVSKVELKEGEFNKVIATSFTGTAKKDNIAKYAKGLKVLSIDEIKQVIKVGKDISGNIDAIKKGADEVLKATEAAIGKVPTAKEEADQAKLNSAYGAALSSVNTNALKYSSDVLLGYVSILKNSLYLAQSSMSKYAGSKVEAKEDDKKEEEK